MGRAARHIHGKAILYADKVTGSMQRALDETDRRRAKQIAYNKQHGITPRGIVKAVQDIMEGAHAGALLPAREYARIAETIIEYAALSPEKVMRKIKQLEQQMHKHARNLEFEQAAQLRDEIHALQEHQLGLVDKKVS
jgi:excinuclease ABC subunit B